jgi:hypothetical protein
LSDTGSGLDTIYANNDDAGSADDGATSGISLAANAGATLSGGGDLIGLNSNGGITVFAYGGGNTIEGAAANDAITLGDTAGNFDAVDGSGDGTLGETGAGSGYTGVYLENNTQASVTGNNDAVTLMNDDAVNASNVSVFLTTGSVGNILRGSNDPISGSNSEFSVVGNNDQPYGTHDTYYYDGSGDGTYQGTDNPSPFNFDNGSDYGNGYDATYTSGDDAGDPVGYDPTYGTGIFDIDDGSDFAFAGFVGTASPSSTGTNAIAATDLALNDPMAAAAATASFEDSQASAAGMLATSPATLDAEPAMPEWGSTTITWSFVAGATSGANAFSGALGAEEQAVVARAVQAWATASGLDLQQVTDAASADIDIGWGAFATASTGLIGFTSSQQQTGILDPGTELRLEDPAETALTTNAAGQLAYAGSGVTLYQAALHEIGHALGLADSSDPNSVMYYALGPDNTTLDATDIAAISRLYGSETASANTAAVAAAAQTTLASLQANFASIEASQGLTAPTPQFIAPTPVAVVGGNPVLTGTEGLAAGTPGDMFTYAMGSVIGNAAIDGFNPTADLLQFNAAEFPSFAAILAATANNASGSAVIRLDAQNSITLTGLSMASLSAREFAFA